MACGCEELGEKYCNYNYGTHGSCQSCYAVPGAVKAGCDSLGLGTP